MNLVAAAARDCTTDGNPTRICPQTIYSITWEFTTAKQPGKLPSRGLTYPTWGKRKIIFKMPFLGVLLVSWRVTGNMEPQKGLEKGKSTNPPLFKFLPAKLEVGHATTEKNDKPSTNRKLEEHKNPEFLV